MKKLIRKWRIWSEFGKTPNITPELIKSLIPIQKQALLFSTGHRQNDLYKYCLIRKADDQETGEKEGK